MMKTIKTKHFKVTTFVLVLMLTVSCITWNANRIHAQELEIDNTNVQTFAGAGITDDGRLEGTADSNATMSIFVADGSADKYNATNVKWTHDGSGWDGETDVLYEDAGSQQKIFACAPYAADATMGIIYVTASEQVDWLVATATDLTSNNVDLTMSHALTKLVINPSTFGSEVENTSIAKIEVGGMYSTGELNIASNTWNELSSANATLEMNNNELLVIPMAACPSFDVVITMEDGKVFTTAVDLAPVNNKLEAGTQYKINLQVGQDKVTIGGITAESWISSTGGLLETE